MNPYTVDWTTAADDELTLIWLHTFDRAVTDAQHQIERLLSRNPSGHGQLLHEGLYRIIYRPLTVFYSIDQINKIVEITDVRYTP